MLPGKVYEVLPYAYVGLGLGTLLMFDSWLAILPGLYIAAAGAVIWILRSNNRRSDVKNANEKYGGVLPFWLYEMLPFSYCSAALLLFVSSENTYAYPFAMLMLVIGMHVWMLRVSSRKHQRPVLVKRYRPLHHRI